MSKEEQLTKLVADVRDFVADHDSVESASVIDDDGRVLSVIGIEMKDGTEYFIEFQNA